MTLDVLANDTDPDGDSLALTSNTQPAHGSASCSPSGECTYTPEADYNGAESFTYGITDGRGAATATVDITVIAVNDAPVADDLEITTDKDVPISVALAAADADDDPLTYSIVGSPAHGALSGTGANLTYTPDPNYNGPDSFAFTADDGAAESNVATVAITVSPVNDAPAITNTEPAPGSSTSDRTPTIRATVSDVETDLTAGRISLRLDGQSRSYSYDRSTDRLVFTPSRKLSYGSHTVSIAAQDGAGLTTTETWSFRVVRR